MAHLLRHPAGGPYTTTVTLDPSLVAVQEENITPVQSVVEAGDGTLWRFQESTNRRQIFEIRAEFLHEADSGSNSGFTSLKSFIQTTVNYSITAFDLTHTDTGTTTVIYLSGLESFRETKQGRFAGTIRVAKEL